VNDDFRPTLDDCDVWVRVVCRLCGYPTFEIVRANDRCPNEWAGMYGIHHCGGVLADRIEWRGSGPESLHRHGHIGTDCRVDGNSLFDAGTVQGALRKAMRQGEVVKLRLKPVHSLRPRSRSERRRRSHHR
jgi:hypothetical protein